MVTEAMPFPPFLELSDTQPALAYSPMIRGIEHTLAYIAENDLIGLTPLGAFKRIDELFGPITDVWVLFGRQPLAIRALSAWPDAPVCSHFHE